MPIRSVDATVNLASTAARRNASSDTAVNADESLRRDFEALQAKHRALERSISSSGPSRGSRSHGRGRGGSWNSYAQDGSRARNDSRDRDGYQNYRPQQDGYSAPSRHEHRDGYRPQQPGNQGGRGRRRGYSGNRGASANLAFDDDDDDYDPAYAFMLDIDETADAFATVSQLPLSTNADTPPAAPSVPPVEAPMYPDMCKSLPQLPFTKLRINSVMASVGVLGAVLIFLSIWITSLGGNTVIVNLLNSAASAWFQCASVSSVSVLGLGLLTKKEFIARGAFLFLAICCCFAPYAETLSIRPTVTDNVSVLNTVLGHTSDGVVPFPHVALVSQGTSSNFSLTWCQDGGANRHVTPLLSDFTEKYRAAKIPITVAKAGVIMDAIGVGDCRVHTLDNMGRPHTILLRDVLHVPCANKHLMSGSCLAAQGYQLIPPCPNANFPPGLYLPVVKLPANSQPRFIPLQTIHGLHFISSRSDVLNEETPNVRRNQLVVYSRKLGFCPLPTLWETRKVVRGLETLHDSHFPRNFVSDPERRGKMTNVERPSSTGHRASRCNEVWHMDTLGPTRNRSIQGYYHNTAFTCDHSGYVFSYGHSNMSQIPAIMAQFYS